MPVFLKYLRKICYYKAESASLLHNQELSLAHGRQIKIKQKPLSLLSCVGHGIDSTKVLETFFRVSGPY